MYIAEYPLSEHEHALLPSDEDVRFYQEHGWFMTGKVFTDEELDAFAQESRDYYAGKRDRRLPTMPSTLAYWTPEDGDVARNNDYVHYESDTFRRLLTKPIIGAIAARLAQTDEIRVWNSALITKPARGDFAAEGMFRPVVPWHKDAHYWSTCTSSKLLTAFINFYDCFEGMGALEMIDGSHRWREVDANDSVTRHFGRRSIDELQTMLEETAQLNGDTVRKIPMTSKRGHISFHNCHTFHGSSPNYSQVNRVSISLHLQDGGNTYKRHTLEDGSALKYNNDYFCRQNSNGDPDYTDPDFCPQIWKE
ncbi:phytanoyl-CoA dioxygenase family protein [Hahella sp. KA22]|uniref:phytanoyl-CoA dioxygenase family protein n=1 Tax=Hahella sp. KA22 TaxID=1628392 RepID=UPI000FDCF12F|nr:phytanoyl-CoA dioxygenase family protein [Hahella sp. KA22]AZZ93760.1 phytanoyl-CoA dioxygenase family protein [Hahella sp. KA22]QAY57134.1 phytanoyl-CoA dioxygenase family protein [Hahella sp. KA22]